MLMIPDASWMERVSIGYNAQSVRSLLFDIELQATETMWYLPSTVTGLVWFPKMLGTLVYRDVTPAEEPDPSS